MEKIANVSKKINHGFHRLSCHAHKRVRCLQQIVLGNPKTEDSANSSNNKIMTHFDPPPP